MVAFAGRSGVGKTTLLAALAGVFRGRGLAVGAIKHSQGFRDPDPPGKDSRRIRDGGARRLVLASPDATIAFHQHPGAEPDFQERLDLLGAGLDLILVESYRSHALPTVEVLRKGHSETAEFAGEPRLLALAADFEPEGAGVPVLPLDAPEEVAAFLLRALGLD